jgi:hypothetical protein
MTLIIQQGSRITTAHEDSLIIHDALPARTYIVGYDGQKGSYYLEPAESFNLPKKIYDDSEARADRILDTFESRPNQTGVLLNGVKGAGKTLLAKQVSLKGVARGFATILVNQPWCGDGFNSFIQSIDHPAILIFDEFEKIYDHKEQQALLTLLDGVFPTKKLFILTTNKQADVSHYILNRPGRVFYSLTYDYLSPELIEEYCNDNLDDKSQIPAIVTYTRIFNFFNFDIIAAVVEEMNRYKESFDSVLAWLNVSPDTNNREGDKFKIEMICGNKSEIISHQYHGFNPMNWGTCQDLSCFGIDVDEEYEHADHAGVGRGNTKTSSNKDVASHSLMSATRIVPYNPEYALADSISDEFDDTDEVSFSHSDMVSYDKQAQTFTYKQMYNGLEIIIVATKIQAASAWDWRAMAV